MADYDFRLIGEYRLFRSGKEQRAIVGPQHNIRTGQSSSIWVDADVCSIGWDDRFILAYQCFPRGGDASSTVGWWLIDTQAGEISGPLDEADLRSRMADLGIPNGISIDPSPGASGDVEAFETRRARGE